MPESVEVCAGSPKKDESPAPSGEVRWEVEDPSEFRPDILSDMGKDETEFRVFNETDPRFDIVKKTYTEMHKYQTVDSVRARMAKWCKLDRCKMTIMEALMKLDQIIDESDPDTSMPNSVHCFQTAERIRAVHPDKEWLHLTGLIHDIGKVVALWGEPQYAVVGDTFPVGCEFSKKCVLHESFEDNPDHHDQRYNTKFGMYEPGCGLDKVLMSFGHDEYLYRVLIGNEQCQLPEESLYIIRFHSFYPWHTGGDYDHLCNDKDRSMLKWIREFNKFDLYSKADDLPKPEDLMDYYQKLIDKYIPGVLNW